jgi:hypothetical protein
MNVVKVRRRDGTFYLAQLVQENPKRSKLWGVTFKRGEKVLVRTAQTVFASESQHPWAGTMPEWLEATVVGGPYKNLTDRTSSGRYAQGYLVRLSPSTISKAKLGPHWRVVLVGDWSLSYRGRGQILHIGESA